MLVLKGESGSEQRYHFRGMYGDSTGVQGLGS